MLIVEKVIIIYDVGNCKRLGGGWDRLGVNDYQGMIFIVSK